MDSDKISTPHDVDRFISAELPDQSVEPALHRIVTTLMMHGPCGSAMPSSSCMKEDRCSKGFPKPLQPVTRFDDSGHVFYRRSIVVCHLLRVVFH